MKRHISSKVSYAVSEVVGGMLLITIAVLAFGAIAYMQILNPNLEPIDENIKLEGSVTLEGKVIIKHVGGQSISNYEIVLRQVNGSFIGSKDYRDTWTIGECRYPLEDIGCGPLLNETDIVDIFIYTSLEDGSQQELFSGILNGPVAPINPYSPILISSLRDDSPDEDLICYSYPVMPDINDTTTYIYNWKLNGVPLCDLNMPFDTENNDTSKDYSGHGLDGALTDGVIWTADGTVGGAVYLSGSSEYISISLPNVFYDMPNNDFTISIWVKSDDISVDDAVVLMASKDNDNFVKIFSQGNEIHIGTCIDGIQEAVRTEDLLSNDWYHIVIVWDASDETRLVYCNGQQYTLDGDRTSLGSGKCLLEVGHGTASSKFWKGYLDELEVYTRALTRDQIYQMYLTTKDGNYDKRIFVSEETSVGDIWQCIVTPNNQTQDGTPVPSNTLRIVNYPGGD
jgi:hypothetical protein